MKILLFGVTGLVGTEFEMACQAHPVTLVGLSHQDINITDLAEVRSRIQLEKPDAVINLVAIPSINPCEENPDLAFSLHVTAPLNMIKTCAELQCVYIQASSHAVFDGTKTEPYTEEDRPNPLNVYGASKYVSEIMTANLCPKHYIVRLATMYGRRRNKSLGFVDKMVEMIKNGAGLRVADDKIDSPTYAHDVAKALLNILTEEYPYGVYHLVNSGAVSYFDFVCTLRDLFGAKNVIYRAKDRDFPALGLKPLRTALRSIHLDPMRPWRDALEAYVDAELRQ